MTYPHQSIFVSEILSFFSHRPLRSFIDGTLGAGGHAEAILKAHPEIENFIGIDQDPEALDLARKRLQVWQNRITYVHDNFATMDKHAKDLQLKQVDGILLDLGVSSMQLDQAEKGFSFMRDGPLDMRMDPTNDFTAATIVNTWSEKDLGKIFRDKGEEKKWKIAAYAIVKARSKQPIITTKQLVDVLEPFLSSQPWKQKARIHPATLVFQALRLTVNKELEMLEVGLNLAIDLLAPQGILAVISFHSLEDRIVKNILRSAASDKESTSGLGGLFIDKTPQITILTRKPLTPKDTEIECNPRSRSAKLRIAQKL